MIRFCLALFVSLVSGAAQAQDKLVVSIWGGSWRDLIAETVAKKFTAETGTPVDFITGGTIDRLNKEKLAKGNPESDITFTTSHVGWLYANDGLFEPLDISKIPNAKNLADEARISPYHLGAWAYVYTIGYRTDLMKEAKFESWNDLWNPDLKAKLAAPDFDPSHIIVVSAMLSGADAAHWEKGEDKLKALKPNFKASYTNDANSQQLLASGETPLQIVLSMNAYYMMAQGVPITLAIPKEGAVLGIDTVAIMKGSKKIELAYKFINTLYGGSAVQPSHLCSRFARSGRLYPQQFRGAFKATLRPRVPGYSVDLRPHGRGHVVGRLSTRLCARHGGESAR
jgi:putative spermidine/putrescine transport system substrate-binding protein